MPQALREAIDEELELARRSTRGFEALILDLAAAHALARQGARERALGALGELLGETMALSDLLGRRRLLLEADHARARRPDGAFSDGEATVMFRATPVVPRVPFEEAVADLVSREPRLARDAAEVARLYRERHGFALARSIDLKATERAQRFLEEALREGRTIRQAEEVISGLGDWGRAYSETVYRTNLKTAYTAGRFRQAADPDVAGVIGAFEYRARLDADVRPNHAAAHGLIASQFDDLWREFSPPLGHNCRCSLRLVDRFELEELGLLDRSGRVRRRLPATFSAAHPDPAFGARRARPDQLIYG